MVLLRVRNYERIIYNMVWNNSLKTIDFGIKDFAKNKEVLYLRSNEPH